MSFSKIALSLFFVITLAAGGMWLWLDHNQPKPYVNVSPLSISTTTTSTPSEVASNRNGMKLYRNKQFGFEFWYPEGWEWEANLFGSPYSKFNLTVIKIDGKNTYQDDVINVVTPAFADNADHNFWLAKATTSTVVVDGIAAIEYDYSLDAPPAITIDIPTGDSRILFTMDGAHKKELNAILSTFKFLK